MKITLFLRPGKSRNSELPLYVRFRNGSTDIKQVTRLVVNPEYWDDKTHKLKTKMRLPDELRQTFNHEQVALEEYISNSFYSCEDKDGIDASWLESVLAASHMARRTFIGNLYKKVQDPNIVASLSGHVEGSRAFSRYREIDKEIKTNVVKLLDD